MAAAFGEQAGGLDHRSWPRVIKAFEFGNCRMEEKRHAVQTADGSAALAPDAGIAVVGRASR